MDTGDIHCTWRIKKAPHCFMLCKPGLGRGGAPHNGLHREALPHRVPF